MNVVVECACGQTVYFGTEHAGTRRLCPYCDVEILIPGRIAREENPLGLISHTPAAGTAPKKSRGPSAPSAPYEIPEPSPELAAAIAELESPTPIPPQRPGEAWGWRCLIWSVTLIPLFFSLMAPVSKTDIPKRLLQTISHLSADQRRQVDESLKQKPGEPELDDIVMALPQHRIEGAHLAMDSWGHWLYAAGAGIVFMLATMLLLPSSSAKPGKLLKAGLFTGTIGMLLLLAFQIAAAVTQGVRVRGFGIIALMIYLLKPFGYSYSAAADPTTGFIASALGFTFGVGFCEEACKLIPALKRVPSLPPIGWRGAYLFGLVSGFGFGISEGITYGSSYNGIQTAGIYAVRFISCVALHGIWSGAAAITLYERRSTLWETDTLPYLLRLLQIIAVPMLLHGLYDTLLKKNMDGLTLLAAIVSFAWMTFLILRMRRKESSSAPSPNVENDEQAFSHV